MNYNWIFALYYIYCLLLILGTGYVVFILDFSGAWFILTLIFCSTSPQIKTKGKK